MEGCARLPRYRPAMKSRETVLPSRMRSLLLLLAALFGSAQAANAHPMLQNVMWIQFESTRAHVAVNVSVREIAVAQGLTANDDSFDTAAVAMAAEKYRDYVLQHLQFRANGRFLRGRTV